MDTTEVWKEFEHNEITHSVAHHLMAIEDLISERGYARVTDVAKHLNITKGSASITLRNLKERGYIDEDENKFFNLSETGQKIVKGILSRRRIFIKFFRDVLGLEPTQAEIDACKIEHLISKAAGERLLILLQFVLSTDPIAGKFMERFREYQNHLLDPNDCHLKDVCAFDDLCDEKGCIIHQAIEST
ncbi:MAG: metal-dependent transcriptional regulator [Gemmatimonadetes bacterium]|nr:MAG: metal-dependent transcriptional regulator [Gemmatimonadota bacterium]